MEAIDREAMAATETMTKFWEWIEKVLECVHQSPSMTLFWTSLLIVSATSLPLSSFLFGLHYNRTLVSVWIWFVRFLAVRMKLRKPDTILLTGLNGSGKTVLFYQLRDGCCKQKTVQSQEPNEESFILHSETSWNSKVRPVHIIDLPGDCIVDGFLHKTDGIVFVVDSTEISWNCHLVSKYLYEIITKAIVVKKKIPVLILCNKTDMLTAHSKEFIARQLEKSINRLCMSRPDASDVRRKEFTFSNCHTQVTVSEASGLTGDIAQVEAFIRKNVKY
ncbi:hypothetical protein V2J09_015451 [Rumex salicifolius]